MKKVDRIWPADYTTFNIVRKIDELVSSVNEIIDFIEEFPNILERSGKQAEIEANVEIVNILKSMRNDLH